MISVSNLLILITVNLEKLNFTRMESFCRMSALFATFLASQVT